MSVKPFSHITAFFRKQHVGRRVGRRSLGKLLALEALECRAMMTGNVQLDAVPEAVPFLDDTFDADRGKTDAVRAGYDEHSDASQFVIQVASPKRLWEFFHREVEMDRSMKFYRHDLPEQYIPPGGTPYWSIETPDGRAMLDDTWYRLPNGDFVSKNMSADLDSDGEADVFSYRYANMHDYGPSCPDTVWICGGFYSRVSHSAIYDWNDDGPLIETYVPPVRNHAIPSPSEQSPAQAPQPRLPDASTEAPAAPTGGIPHSFDHTNVLIAQCYASPDLWQTVWGDTGAGTDASPTDALQTSPEDDVIDSPVVSDPVAELRDDGWENELLEVEQPGSAESSNDTVAEAIVNDFGDTDLIPQSDFHFTNEN